jgi:hypothetical protein
MLMPHPLVDQLRFTRSEFQRGLAGLTDEETRRRFGPMNCIAWNVGHLAWQEQRYWLEGGQGRIPSSHSSRSNSPTVLPLARPRSARSRTPGGRSPRPPIPG